MDDKERSRLYDRKEQLERVKETLEDRIYDINTNLNKIKKEIINLEEITND